MRPLPVLVLLLSLTFAAAPLLSGPFDGFRPGQLPIPQEDPPIQPAGWAFSIWGVIYLGLVASAIFGLLRRADDPDWDRVRVPLLLSLAVGTPWIAVAQASAVAGALLILPMAGMAIWALLRTPDRDALWLRLPVGLYAGWLTAASVVAVTIVAAGYGILTDALGWAFLGIPTALLLAAAVLWNRPSAWAYAGAVAWALLGIAIKNGATFPSVTLLAVVGIAALLALAWARGHEPAEL